jgi:cytochrome c oxidase subunit 2
MMPSPRPRAKIGAVALAGALAFSACAANSSDADAIQLSPTAAEGRTISRTSGCAACHGSSGDGGVGPTFVGLYGSTVTLDDGTTLVADRDYLIEAIKEPGAKIVAGYRLPMPTNRLTDDEIDKVLTYIQELSGAGPGTTP